MMIVNETKTKVMVYGSACRDVVVKFNDKVLNVVDQYKYLGNVMKSVKTCKEDVFGENFQYLCNKARKAIFAMFKPFKKSRNSTRQNYKIFVSVTHKTYSGIWKWSMGR